LASQISSARSLFSDAKVKGYEKRCDDEKKEKKLGKVVVEKKKRCTFAAELVFQNGQLFCKARRKSFPKRTTFTSTDKV